MITHIYSKLDIFCMLWFALFAGSIFFYGKLVMLSPFILLLLAGIASHELSHLVVSVINGHKPRFGRQGLNLAVFSGDGTKLNMVSGFFVGAPLLVLAFIVFLDTTPWAGIGNGFGCSIVLSRNDVINLLGVK